MSYRYFKRSIDIQGPITFYYRRCYDENGVFCEDQTYNPNTHSWIHWSGARSTNFIELTESDMMLELI